MDEGVHRLIRWRLPDTLRLVVSRKGKCVGFCCRRRPTWWHRAAQLACPDALTDDVEPSTTVASPM